MTTQHPEWNNPQATNQPNYVTQPGQIPAQAGPSPASGQVPPPIKSKRRRRWPWVVGVLVALVVIGSATGTGETPAPAPAAAPTPAPSPVVPAPLTPIQQAAPVAAYVPDVDVADLQRQLDAARESLESATAPEPAAPAAPAAPAGPATTAEDGTYEVGRDLVAGRYRTAGPAGDGPLDMCYMARKKDDSAELDSIISNEIIKGQSSVTVKKGEFVEFTGGCTWTKS